MRSRHRVWLRPEHLHLQQQCCIGCVCRLEVWAGKKPFARPHCCVPKSDLTPGIRVLCPVSARVSVREIVDAATGSGVDSMQTRCSGHRCRLNTVRMLTVHHLYSHRPRHEAPTCHAVATSTHSADHPSTTKLIPAWQPTGTETMSVMPVFGDCTCKLCPGCTPGGTVTLN